MSDDNVTQLRRGSDPRRGLRIPLTAVLDEAIDKIVFFVPSGDDKVARKLFEEAPRVVNKLGAHGIEVSTNDVIPLILCRMAQIIADLKEAIRNGHG